MTTHLYKTLYSYLKLAKYTRNVCIYKHGTCMGEIEERTRASVHVHFT